MELKRISLKEYRLSSMWKTLRISILLYIALVIGVTSWSTRARHAEWKAPLWVTVYPINGDGSEAADNYIRTLKQTDFHPIESYFIKQADIHSLKVERPVELKLSEPVETAPPEPPNAATGLSVIFWSLHLRWYSWWENNFKGPSDIKVFVLYYDPASTPHLQHSLGLRKGFLGVVHAFADDSYRDQNHVVIAHEMMHTLGASDQYDLTTNYPLFPEGFADPYREPNLPQTKATLMAGRIPIDLETSKMPSSLKQTIISPKAAFEIGWKY
ncbi:MAG: hypothetical protein AAF387_15120 [Pseudomonadota bacterium]